MGLARLAFELSTGESTIEAWVRQGKFPAPRHVGGKRLWAWKEVERFINATDTLPSTYRGESMVGLSVAMVERYCRFADQKQSALAAVHHLDRLGTGLEQERRNVTTSPFPKALKE